MSRTRWAAQMRVYALEAGTHKRIVAATSKERARVILDITHTAMKNYCCVTGNKAELELALATPGVVFRKSYKLGSAWERELAEVAS